MLDTYVLCDVGLKRKINEDSFLVDKQNNFAMNTKICNRVEYVKTQVKVRYVHILLHVRLQPLGTYICW